LETDQDTDWQRLDKWLVFARFVRTRGAADKLIGAGHVRLNGAKTKSSAHRIKIGDVLTLALPHATEVVAVAAFGDQRGSAPQARLLYSRVVVAEVKPEV
jgi:ribosome-associated heat shock protein Hsp15